MLFPRPQEISVAEAYSGAHRTRRRDHSGGRPWVVLSMISTADGATALKFFNQATQAFEFDSSQTFNEPGNYALRSAIETAVIELIKKGERSGLWQFKEKSNELVQKEAPR